MDSANEPGLSHTFNSRICMRVQLFKVGIKFCPLLLLCYSRDHGGQPIGDLPWRRSPPGEPRAYGLTRYTRVLGLKLPAKCGMGWGSHRRAICESPGLPRRERRPHVALPAGKGLEYVPAIQSWYHNRSCCGLALCFIRITQEIPPRAQQAETSAVQWLAITSNPSTAANV